MTVTCCTDDKLAWSLFDSYFTEGTDYSLATGPLTLSPSNPHVNQSLSILKDGIVLEETEVFSLQLHRDSGQPTADLRGATVVINDTDGQHSSVNSAGNHA